jgi:hypothetical protein
VSALESTIHIYSETSLNQPALGPKNMAGLEEWPVLWHFLCKEFLGRYSGRTGFLMFRKVSLYLIIIITWHVYLACIVYSFLFPRHFLLKSKVLQCVKILVYNIYNLVLNLIWLLIKMIFRITGNKAHYCFSMFIGKNVIQEKKAFIKLFQSTSHYQIII